MGKILLLVLLLLTTFQDDRPTVPYKVYFPLFSKGWPGKKGVALYPGSPCGDVTVIGASWQYGWHSQPARCPGVENVPMVSCGVEALRIIGGITSLDSDSEWLMLYNEPDLILPITPEDGAILYRRLLPFVGGRKVVAPAPSELHVEWLPQFRQAHLDIYGEPPTLDALAAHCYKQSAAECKVLVERFIAWADEWEVMEVWVTEFSFVDRSEAREFIAWMKDEPKVTRYAWYTNRLPVTRIADAPLVEWGTGRLTAWGEMYRLQ